jgi:hypothetical protein
LKELFLILFYWFRSDQERRKNYRVEEILERDSLKRGSINILQEILARRKNA